MAANNLIAAQRKPKMLYPSAWTDFVLPRGAVQAEVVSSPGPPPTQISLGTLSDLGFRVVAAIPIDISVESHTVVACWTEIDEFGTGSSMSLACQDLGHTLVELYQSLEADEDRLGPDLQLVLALLRRHVIRGR